jgi:hypothetical protein
MTLQSTHDPQAPSSYFLLLFLLGDSHFCLHAKFYFFISPIEAGSIDGKVQSSAWGKKKYSAWESLILEYGVRNLKSFLSAS